MVSNELERWQGRGVKFVLSESALPRTSWCGFMVPLGVSGAVLFDAGYKYG